MNNKKTILIAGLVILAVIAAGTVIAMNLPSEKPQQPKSPAMTYCTADDNNTTITVPKGNQLNLTLQDYGDGGYTWSIVSLDPQFLKKESEQLNWGSTGMLGDFGKDTWIFSTQSIGTTTLKLECARPFNTTDVAQSFSLTLTIV